MWVNKQFEVADTVSWLNEFVSENTLSTIISHAPVRVTHMPVELVGANSEDAKLIFHVPTVDPVVESLTDDGLVTVVIHGPQQYISPAVYRDVGLPTFNFGVAEVTDRCRVLAQEELRGHLERLMVEREGMFAHATGIEPWTVTAEASARFDQLLPRVAGFEVALKNTQLKLKMGQNRASDDRRHTVEKLRAAKGVDARVTEIMHASL